MSAETFTNTPGRWADRIVQAVGRDLERVTDHELAHHDYTFAAMALDVAKSLREEQSRLDLREFEDYPVTARPVGVDAKLPAWVTEQLDAADRVRNACTLTLANGTPGTAEYVFATDLLDEFRASAVQS